MQLPLAAIPQHRNRVSEHMCKPLSENGVDVANHARQD